ncbi:MAG: hypothetical protein ACRDXE_03265 [Acidimicrobiales bacterium]
MDTTQAIPTLTIPDEAWHPAGTDENDAEGGDQERDRLVAAAIINGTWMHFDAIEVTDDGMRAVGWDETLDRLFDLVSPGGPFDTTTIAGRTYVVFAHPFS